MTCRLSLTTMIMIFALVNSTGAISALGQSPEAGGGSWAKKIGGALYVPVIEMTGAFGQKVLIVGMVHGGPSAYYSRVSDMLSEWTALNARPTIIMKEFGTGKTVAYDSQDVDIPTEKLAEAAEKISSFQPSEFIALSEESLQPILKLFNAVKVPCLMDLDGKTKRPTYLIDRNRRACQSAASFPQQACQFTSLRFPSGPLITEVNADIKFDEAGVGLQIAGFLMYRGFDKMTIDLETKIDPLAMYVIMDYRMQLLEKEIQQQIDAGARQIIIPWGAVHAKDVKKFLVRLGFKQTGLKDVLWARADQVAQMPDLAATYNDPSLSEQYDSQQ